MRRHLLLLVLALTAACGSSVTPTGVAPPPPPPAPGPPASITIVSGDGQSAAPGTLLPAKVSVLVKDASGAPVPGVVVHFTVDSGGGAIASSTATTGSTGIAIGGDWTLGAAAGANVITAAVTSLTPVRLHAQAFSAAARPLFTNTPVGAGGGTITYTRVGDPLNGLKIVVPAAAYPVATSWTLTADSSVLPRLPSGFSQVGPTLVIGNGQDFADGVMTLTMPLRVGATETAAPFYFDPATNTLEGIPVVAATDSTVTLATKHFTADEMAIPGSGPTLSGLRSSLRLGFGAVRIVWVRTGTANLIGNWSSTFRPGVDDWEFINYGDYIAPGGDCEGMSITAMFYHYYYHPNGQGQGLYHQFDQSLANQWDNVQGIRFAGSVQGDFESKWSPGVNQIVDLMDEGIVSGTPTKFLTSTWILLTLKLTQQPVLVALQGPSGGHAVVAYAATFDGTNTQVSIADPNHPGVPQSMTFRSGVLDPIPLQTNATTGATFFTTAFALSVTADIPLAQINSRWIQFQGKSAGKDRYPTRYRLQDSLAGSLTWSTVAIGDTVWTAAPFGLRNLCADCPITRVGGGNVQFFDAWDQAGNNLLTHDTMPGPLADGISSYVIALEAFGRDLATGATGLGFVDAQPLTIRYHQLTATAPPGMVPGTPITLTAHPGVLATFQSVYTWTFNDGGSPAIVTVIGDSNVTRTFPANGPYSVFVNLVDPVHAPQGYGANATVTVGSTAGADIAWQFTSVSAPNIVLPPGGIGIEADDTTIQVLFNGFVNNLVSTPQNSLFYLRNANGCKLLVLEQFPPGQFAAVLDTTLGGAVKGLMGYNCPTTDYQASLAIGPLGSGTLVASVVDIPQPDAILLPGGSINATMVGRVLQGSFTWRVHYSTGYGVYSFTFQGTQIRP